jgi:hypothetical protein
VRVLAIDGGGIRGLIPAVVLAEIERRIDRPIAECVDLIAGTSTGGIIACALARPGVDGTPIPAEELAALYVEEGPRIFHTSLLRRIRTADGILDERYDDLGLLDALRRYLGDTMLSEAIVPVMIPAYDIEGRLAFFFRSERARRDRTYDFSLVQAARATAAAPTYFEPAHITDAAGEAAWALIDGGVYAVNPSLVAYVDVVAGGHADDLELLLSLGTGQNVRPLPYARAKNWGQLEWARPIVDVVFDGMADTTEFALGTILGQRYVRLQTQLRRASDALDDATPDNLMALQAEAERLISERSAEIDAACAALVAPRSGRGAPQEGR